MTSYREPDADVAAAEARREYEATQAEAAQAAAFKQALGGGRRRTAHLGLLLMPVFGVVIGFALSPAPNGAAWAEPFIGGLAGGMFGTVLAGVGWATLAVTSAVRRRL